MSLVMRRDRRRRFRAATDRRRLMFRALEAWQRQHEQIERDYSALAQTAARATRAIRRFLQQSIPN